MGRKKKKRQFVMRPWSKGRCPTADEVREAWANRHRSTKDFIWLLSVLGELTCFTDCNLEHLGGFGNIAGRRGGLKEFLETEVPELATKYKSISRHATLATRLKIAFSYYPPAPISLIHPDLPKPGFEVPYITNYAHQLYHQYFESMEPTYVAFSAVVDKRRKAKRPRYRWGPALPREAWPEAEGQWYRYFVRHKLIKSIRLEHTFYARDYSPWDDYRYQGHGAYEY